MGNKKKPTLSCFGLVIFLSCSMAINLYEYVYANQDFPKPGILFRDIQPLLANNKAFKKACTEMYSLATVIPDYWIGIEARGFIFASALSALYGGGFKMIRKEGKLPDNNLQTTTYGYEYATATIQMQGGGSGTAILIDDVVATGHTMEAADELANICGYDVVDKIALIDIGIAETDIKTVLQYD